MTDYTSYQSTLEKELQTLEEQLKGLGMINPDDSEDWLPLPPEASKSQADENVVADRNEDLEATRGTVDVLEKRYNNVNRALKKMAAGSYGECEICQAAIETDRLDANPAARTCKAHLEEEVNLTK